MRVLPNLTPLRFFLSLFVVLFHVPQFCKNQGFPFFDDWSVFHKGSEAVYMFFSLSGFLIIRQLYIEKKETNTLALKSFYIRRILRIFPLYYLVLLFGLCYYHIILPWAGYAFENNYNLVEGILLAVFFLPNVFSELYHPGGILEILWSIGIEEQFYLIVAPLMLLLKAKHIIRFLAVFTLLYFVLFFSGWIPQLYKFSMFFFYFSSGGLFSILILNKKVNDKVMNVITTVSLSLLLLYFTTSIFKATFDIITYHLFSMLLFGLSLSVLIQKSLPIFDNRLFNYLGKISYGIYMYHAIMMQFAGFLYLKILSDFHFSDGVNIILFNFIVLIITIVTAGLSYKYYESFFLKRKHFFQRKQIET